MTYLPPIPDAASAPYPPHPAPIPEAPKLATAAAEAAAELLVKRVGMGLGAALLLGAAAWGFRLYTRRAPAPARSRPAGAKTKRGARQDRARVAAGEQYEVRYFARKHRISASEARAIIRQAGPSRKDANRLAEARKSGAEASA